jgi:hypothetical protein
MVRCVSVMASHLGCIFPVALGQRQEPSNGEKRSVIEDIESQSTHKETSSMLTGWLDVDERILWRSA